MFKATKLIEAALKEKNMKCSVEETEKSSYVSAGIGGKQCNFKIRFISRDDDNDVSVRVYGLVRVPEDKRSAVLAAINKANSDYRFVKFTLDSDGDVNISFDMAVRTEDPGPVALEILIRISKIVDVVYPTLMKAIWS